MQHTLYMDNSNIWIEGKRVSAVRRGLAKNINEAGRRRISDSTYRLDFGRLIDITCGFGALADAKLYGSRPPEHDTVWKAAKEKGFELHIFNRSAYGKEKEVDTSIVMHLTLDLVENLDPASDRIVLVAGDRDFLPVVIEATRRKFHVKVAFWNHANHELKRAASEFQDLNPVLYDLTFSRGKR